MTTTAQPHPLTIPGLLTRRADERPDEPLFRAGDTSRTATQMVDAVARTGGTLRAAGVDAGDSVALLASNRSELLDLILGCAWIGAVAVPINTASRGEQLQHILTNSGAGLLVAEPALLDQVEALGDLPALHAVWLIDTDLGGRERRWPTRPMPVPGDPVAAAPVAPGDTAAILYTSGTTGLSKGVRCPHAQFHWWGVNMSDQLGLRVGDVLFTCLPLFHTNALNAFMQAVVCGGSFILGGRFSASRFWGEVAAAGATVTYLLGAMVSILESRPPSPADRSHRVRVALAPATPPHRLATFEERFGVMLLDGYGSTETNGVIGSTPSQRRPGTMGKLRPGFSIRVVDEHGLDVPDGLPGELLVRSDQPYAVASGYHRMPEATAESWQDLWFHSGDRVVIEDGWVRFVDRIKDVIRRRGENISSVEVEQVLRSHPLVHDAAAFPVDSELGEDEVMAALVADGPIDFAEVTEFCASRLANFAVPRFLRVVDALPQTENGKVRKPVLREAGRASAEWDREVAQPRRRATQQA